MRKILNFILAALAVMMVLALRCRASDLTGTTAANFLKIPVAPIPTGMAQAYTAIAGPDSILYNPAGLGLMSYSALSVAHNQYIEGITQEYAAIALHTSIGTFGAGFSTLSSGSIDAYDENGASAGTTSSGHMLGVLSFSQSFPHWNRDENAQDKRLMLSGWSRIADVEAYRPGTMRVSIGASLKYVRERLDDVSASAVTGDAGIVLSPVKRLQLGASVLNISGRQDFGSDGFALARTVRAGAAADFVGRKRLIVFRPSADYVKESDADGYYCSGLEISMLQLFQLRIGYRSNRDLGTGLAFGAGITLDRFAEEDSFFNGVRMDYAYSNEGTFNASHRFGFQILFR